MSQRQELTIKAKCKGVIRLLKIPKDLSYKGFYDLLKNSFGVSQCQLQYSDEEGDLVELGSQEELLEALKVGEKIEPLKVKLITTEIPSMNALDKPCEDNTVSSTHSPEVVAEQVSSLSVNEKPTPKPRPNRKRKGFFTSLCSDVAEFENGKLSDQLNEESDDGVEQKNTSRLKKSPKAQKEANPLRGSKYYSSLADDIAKMRSGENVDYQDGRKEMKRKAPSRKAEKSTNDLPKKRNPSREVKKIEKDMSEMSISDEEPPKWLNKVVHEMSQSVSTRVLGALNVAGIAATNNGSPGKPIKREGAPYIHDGITCNGCEQTIVGPRYKCGNCPDFDLCEECEMIEGIHDKSHVFLKLLYPGIGIGRKHDVMIPLLKDIIYKSDDAKLAEEQDKRMKEVRRKLKQMAKKKREEQAKIKKAEKKMRKLKGGTNNSENPLCGLELELLGDGSYPDGTVVTLGFEFTKCWKIRNNGTVAWNEETKLIYVNGPMRCISSNEAALPHLSPGEEGIASVTFVAPTVPGEYFSVWRASHDGRDFGTNMLCRIKVVEDEIQTDDGNETFVDGNDVSAAPTQIDSRPDTEIRNQESSPTTQEPDPIFHAYIIQENQECEVGDVATNTSENQATTSGVSVLESIELEWDTCLMDDDTSRGIGRNPNNEDDAQDIEVISNASSDDFCVVPLPACFDPDIPLNIEGFENLQGISMDPPQSLAQEMDRDVLLGSSVDNQDPSGYDDAESVEPESAENTNTQDETMDHEDEEEDVRIIPVTPERPRTPQDDLLVQTKSASIPINIEMRSIQRQSNNPQAMPGFDARSTISEPVAPQPPSVERTPLIPGRLPASPPGRAVPVFQTSHPETATVVQYSVPGSFEVHVASEGQTEDVQWRAVRTQPSDNVPAPVYEETVTIQPQAATSGSPTTNTTQSTAQFASTLVTGTLKRAFGTVTDTVTSFMTGKDNAGKAHVIYLPGASSGNNVHVVVPEIAEPVAAEHNREPAGQADIRVLMQQLQEMGFCDRQMNERLLKKYNMDVNKVVIELLQENDNEWSTGRH